MTEIVQATNQPMLDRVGALLREAGHPELADRVAELDLNKVTLMFTQRLNLNGLYPVYHRTELPGGAAIHTIVDAPSSEDLLTGPPVVTLSPVYPGPTMLEATVRYWIAKGRPQLPSAAQTPSAPTA